MRASQRGRGASVAGAGSLLRLRPAAMATDGIVEAVELEGQGWALGVQWHPELMLETDLLQLAIFREVIGQARGRMNMAATAAVARGSG